MKAELKSLSKNTLIAQNIFLIERLNATIQSAVEIDKKNVQLMAEIQNLNERLANFEREVFGDKSEKVEVASVEIEDLDNNGSNNQSQSKPMVAVKPHSRAQRRAQKKKRIDFSRLAVEKRFFELPDNALCPCCGLPICVIKYDIRLLAHHIPAKYIVYEDHIAVGGCQNHCEGAMKRVESDAPILNRMPITNEMLAFIIFSKVVNRQPLYHQEFMFFTQAGLILPRKNLVNWFNRAAELMTPIINLFKEEILGYDVCGLDATRLLVIQVEKEENSDEVIKKNINMYCFLGGPPGKEVVLFEPSFWKHSEYLLEFFLDWVGYIHCDADTLHRKLGEQLGISLILCHAHSRRRFEKVWRLSQNMPGLASDMMALYKDLYDTDREIRKLSDFELIRHARQARLVPILDKMRAVLDEHKENVLKKSGIGRAVSYICKYWEGLLRFLKDGRLPLDNNAVERKIKALAMIRKNFLFSFSMAGARAVGVFTSILQTAIQHGLDPLRYLTTLFQRIRYCTTMADYEKLLPWNIDLPKVNAGLEFRQ